MEEAGDERQPIVMDKHSGEAAFKHTLDDMGIQLSSSSFEHAFARMKRVADLTGEVSAIQVRAIVDEVVTGTEILQGVAESFR